MKAIAVFPEKHAIDLIQQEVPRITSPTEVKLRILEVGICGTDKEICCFEYGTPPPGSDHLVIGHESIGEVVEVGSAVTRLKPGDLAVPMVRRCRSQALYPAASKADLLDRGENSNFCFRTPLRLRCPREVRPEPRERRDEDAGEDAGDSKGDRPSRSVPAPP